MDFYNKIGLVILSLLMICALAAGSIACTAEKTDWPVVLFSDYGNGDYRTPQLKGVILYHNPNANILDGSHAIPSFDIATGAFMLHMAAREFPEKVVFVNVVAAYYRPEPRYLVLTTQKDQVFIAPDNGLLTYIFQEYGIKSLHSVDNQKLFDGPISGLSAERIEGTVGALISSGYQPKDIGAQVTQPALIDVQQPAVRDNQLVGTVVYVDNFGNCITNISGKTAAQFGLKPGDSVQLQIQEKVIEAKYGTIYADVPRGENIVFVTSNLDAVQLSINLGNFSQSYNLKAGTRIGLQKVNR
jgi:S-adenosyl-L-methionine hydrolase (adenosine-forming)